MIFESLPTSTKHHRREFDVWQGLLTSRRVSIKDGQSTTWLRSHPEKFANGTQSLGLVDGLEG